MGYVIVFVVAAAVGVAVYGLTLRGRLQSVPGFAEPGPPEPTYVSVTGGKPDWQSRLTGLLGLVVAVVIGGVGLAAVLYLAIRALVGILGGLAPAASSTVGP